MPLFFDFSDFTQSIFNILFLILLAFQFFWILFFFLKIVLHKEKLNSKVTHVPVSIIIVARNEADNLMKFLPSVLEQKYDVFEVIIVNHQSVDDTKNILNDFKSKYDHLKIIDFIQEKNLSPGKKLPLTIGIKGATYEHLLLTDADCEPASDLWLKTMAEKFSDKKQIVLGYAPHKAEKGFLNKIIRFDTTFIALNYLSFAKSGIPYMGVGRNLAYTKSVFFNNSGFKSHYSIPSGDDDLFIQEVAKNRNYDISLSPLTFCYSDAKTSWSDWTAQKSRHYSTSGKYKFFKKLMLGIYPLTLILLWLNFLVLLFNNWINWTSTILILIFLVLKWIVLSKIFIRFEQKSFVWSVLFWDLFYALLMPFIYYSSKQSIQKKWR